MWESLTKLMTEHPELPVLLFHDECEPPSYVTKLTGDGRLGAYARYGGYIYEDIHDLEIDMLDNDVQDAATAAREAMSPCIWADWEWE